MKVKEIEAGVAEIGRISWDDESAHAKEDELHQEVLKAIAECAENAADLARAALLTKDLDFARWCA